MKLDEIVRSKFFPPICKLSYSKMHFGANQDEMNNINENGNGAHPSYGVSLPTMEQCIQHCWEFFAYHPPMENKQ